MSHTKPVATTIGLLTGLSLVVAGGDADALTMTDTQMQIFGSLAADTGPIGPTSINVTDAGDPSPPSETVAFNLFNAALGTLTGVKFSIDTTTAEGSMSFTATAEGSSTVEGSGNFDASFIATVSGATTGAASNQPFFFTDEAFASCSETGTCMGSSDLDNVPNNVTLFDDMFTVGAVDIASFVGAGTFDVTYTLPLMYDLTVTGFGGDQISGSANADWAGSLTVEYTYDPATAVPEPASWSLLGLGLAGAAAMRRRKHKASAAPSRRKPAA